MKNKISKLIIGTSFLGMSLATGQAALVTDTANITMAINLYATITGLQDFTLTSTSASTYAGTDSFSLVSNGQVRVTATTSALSSAGSLTALTPDLSIDGAGSTFDTAALSSHNASHTITAVADLSNNPLSAGSYTGVITLTVSAI